MTRRRHQCTITLASRARRLVFRPICYIQHCREAPSSMQLSSKHTVFSHSADETPFNHHSIALLPIPYILVYASLVSSSLYTRYRFIHNLQTQDVRAACFAVSQPQKRRVAEFCGIYWRETGDRRCGMWRKATTTTPRDCLYRRTGVVDAPRRNTSDLSPDYIVSDCEGRCIVYVLRAVLPNTRNCVG